MFADDETPGLSHGVIVFERRNGVLRDGRVYRLVSRAQQGPRVHAEISFLEPGAEAYAFTFG